MANELNIQLDPFLEAGLTLLAKVFNQAGAQQGSDAAMTESSTGFYTADFSLASIADGAYTVKFQTSAAFYGSGILNVKGNAEVISSTFDPASDAVTTDTASRDASKADVSSVSTFNPATDVVANVTLVGTTTDLTNAPAGGTTPLAIYTYFTDASREDAFKADVSALSTATSISALNDISTNDIDLRLNAYDAPTKAELDSAVAPLSIFNPASDTVTTDTASREASKANVSALSTAINIAALNNLSTADIDSRLSAYDSPTKAELDSAVSGLSTFDPTATSVTTDTASRLASQNDLALISADAAETRKRVSNRRKIDSIANTETVFDDDNTTPLYVSDLKDKGGNPSSDSPFEIVPQ